MHLNRFFFKCTVQTKWELWSFFSEEKWLNEKTQALKAVTNHVESLKMEKEKLSEQRCCIYSFIFVRSSFLHIPVLYHRNIFTKVGFVKKMLESIFK